MYFISQEENDMELYPLDQKHIMKTYKSGKPCFIGKNIKNKYFKNKDFSGIDFSNMNISYTMFDNCDISDAKFENTKLNNVSFFDCMFTTYANCLDTSGFIKPCSIEEFNKHEIRYCSDTHNLPFCIGGRYKIISNVYGLKVREHPQTDFIGYKSIAVKNFGTAVASLLIRPRNGVVVYKNDICRCAQAVVLKIEGDDGRRYKSGFSYMQPRDSLPITYMVGETVFPDRFDERWDAIGSHGIHFYLSKEEA